MAHINSVKKYNKENYKQLKIDIPIKDMEEIDDYCQKYNLSKRQFIISAYKEALKTIPEFKVNANSNIPASLQYLDYLEKTKPSSDDDDIWE